MQERRGDGRLCLCCDIDDMYVLVGLKMVDPGIHVNTLGI